MHRIALILLCLSLAAVSQTKKAKSAGPSTKPKAASTAKASEAIIHTTSGEMKCTLFPDQAPKAVANFVGLANGTKNWTNPAGKLVHGKPLYDGVIFHRVIPGFMIQAGDPSGTGSGDVGFEFEVELHSDLLFDKPGRLAMANRNNPNSNGSQFFITEKEVPFLNPCFQEGGCPELRRPKGMGYTIFGQCDDTTVELVKKIARTPCTLGPVCDQNNSRLQNPVTIKHIEIVKAGKSSAAKPATKTPAPAKSKTTTAPKPSVPN
jgi:peptidyl-prolyl cis-trans isomerase A (cyclophilin A)